MFTLVYMRNSIDSVDSFYIEEQSFSDKNQPRMATLTNEYYKALTMSPYRSQLEARFGKQLLNKAEFTIETFTPEIGDQIYDELVKIRTAIVKN